MHDQELKLGSASEKKCISLNFGSVAEYRHLCRIASDIDAEIACLEGLDDWQADELARQDKIQKRAIEKIIRNWTERQP